MSRKTKTLISVCVRVLVCASVCAVVGVVWILAMPNSVPSLPDRRTSPTNECINNLRAIDAAKQEWAIEKNKTTNDIPTWDNILPYLGHYWTNHAPICPSGGKYTIGKVGEPPKCSIGGEHRLD